MSAPIRLLCLCFWVALLAETGCRRSSPRDLLVIGEESDPSDFDPRFALDAYSSRIVGLLYAGLVSQDAHARLAPDLAEGWQTPDAYTYVFRLRPGLCFHDGRKLTARDVFYTYRTITDPALNSPRAEDFRDLQRVELIDERTIRFRLKRPFAPFLQALTTGIVPEGAGRELSRRPIGAGPFHLVDFEPGARTILGAFEYYHGGKPRIRRLIIKAIPNDAVRVLELRKGSVHLLMNSIAPDALPMLRANPAFHVIEQPGLNVSYLGFNLRDPVLSKREVRRAIAHAIDRESIIKNLLGGSAITTSTVLAPMLWAHAAGLRAYRHDRVEARRWLAAAGFHDPDGNGPEPALRLSYKTSTNPLRRRIADALAEQLAAVGIRVEVRSLEFGTFFDDVKKGNFQLYSLVWVGIAEPDALYNMFHSARVPPAGANRGHYQNAEIDALLELGRRVLDEGERKRIYETVQRQLIEDLPYIPLWVQNDIAVVSKRVRGFRLYPGGDYTGVTYAWIEEPVERAAGHQARAR